MTEQPATESFRQHLFFLLLKAILPVYEVLMQMRCRQEPTGNKVMLSCL
ncbi:hypothetical protein [uncultured Bacteroides sp.]|nr:hypothetical protein [uncultured Bacteroides sp.]